MQEMGKAFDDGANREFTANAAVIGHPVGHSLSPAIHNAIYDAWGIPWRYGLADCPAREDVEAAVYDARMRAMRAQSAGEMAVGFNVTTPYKDAALAIADKPNASSEIVGCANVLTFAEECNEVMCAMVLGADTTDGEGACRALARAGAQVEDGRLLVCGTGGAARSIAFSALMRGAGEILVASRDPQRAQLLLDKMLDRADRAADEGRFFEWGFGDDRHLVRWHRPAGRLRAVGYDGIDGVARRCDAIVNATPLGMVAGDASPLSAESFAEGQVAMDAVYAHGETAFLRNARAAGAQTIDGLPMLVEQALATIALWCGANWMEFGMDDPRNRDALAAAGIA